MQIYICSIKIISFIFVFYLYTPFVFGVSFKSQKLVVAGPSPHLVETVREISRAGGNIFDAAVAGAFTLSVTNPYFVSLGAGGFALIRVSDGGAPKTLICKHNQQRCDMDAAESRRGKPLWGRGEITPHLRGRRNHPPLGVVDFREFAPKDMKEDFYIKNKKSSRVLGGAVGVPGFVAGMWAIHRRYGVLPWGRILRPAIHLAEKGFIVSGGHYRRTQKGKKKFNQAGRNIFFHKGESYLPGERLKQPGLAKALRLLKKGRSVFYRGTIGKDVVRTVRRNGGVMRMEDLHQYRVRWLDPIQWDFGGYQFYSMPLPSSGGIILFRAARLMEKVLARRKHNLYSYDNMLSPFSNNLLKGSDMRFTTKQADNLLRSKAELALRRLFKKGNSHNLRSRDTRAADSRRWRIATDICKHNQQGCDKHARNRGAISPPMRGVDEWHLLAEVLSAAFRPRSQMGDISDASKLLKRWLSVKDLDRLARKISFRRVLKLPALSSHLQNRDLQSRYSNLSPVLNNLLKGSNMRFTTKQADNLLRSKAELALRRLFKTGDSHYLQKHNLHSRDKVAAESRRWRIATDICKHNQQGCDKHARNRGAISPPMRGETTHFSVMDNKGQAVSMTLSLNSSYGSFVVTDRYGVVLNNHMDDFNTHPGQPNQFDLIQGRNNIVRAHRRPLSSMSPTIVERDGRVVLAIGASGGPMIISAVFQVCYRYLIQGLGLDEAIQFPRVHHQFLPRVLYVDKNRFSPLVLKHLKRRGHKIEQRDFIAKVMAVARTYRHRMSGDILLNKHDRQESDNRAAESRRNHSLLEGAFDARGEGAVGGL